MQNMDLHDIREDYSKQALSEADCADLPLVQLQQWLNEAMAAKVNEPTAMNVATVDANGLPSARIVLLKEVNAAGLVFFSNYHSRKGRALAAHPYAAATFFWPELERQVRVEGRVQILAAAESDAYFQSRPRDSRIGAWASDQSREMPGRATFLKRIAEYGARYAIGDVPRPPHWSGFRVVPQRFEFWKDMPFRLHERRIFTPDGDGGWGEHLIYP